MAAAKFVLLALSLVPLSSGQSFDIASVKSGGDVFSTRPQLSTGRIRWTTQLCYLIGYAYRLDFSLVTSPDCGAVYSLEATFDPAASEDQVRTMVKGLLIERFHMQAEMVSKEREGLALVLAKSGARLRPAREGDDPPPLPEWMKDASPDLKSQTFISATMPSAGIVAITGRNVPIARLAETLQRVSATSIWDRTGLTGDYYFAFEYASDPNDGDAPSLASALQENLGLHLEKATGDVTGLVVRHIEKPTGN